MEYDLADPWRFVRDFAAAWTSPLGPFDAVTRNFTRLPVPD